MVSGVLDTTRSICSGMGTTRLSHVVRDGDTPALTLAVDVILLMVMEQGTVAMATSEGIPPPMQNIQAVTQYQSQSELSPNYNC